MITLTVITLSGAYCTSNQAVTFIVSFQSPYHGYNGNDRHHQGPLPESGVVQRSGSVDSENDTSISVMNRSDSVGAGLGVMPRDNLTPWEELQLVRRQIAKLNHRLVI